MSQHRNGVIKEARNGEIKFASEQVAQPASYQPWLIYFLSFLDLFGVSMIAPLLPSHIKQIGISPFISGVLGSVYGLVQFISSPYIGSYSDTHGRYTILILCQLLTGCSYILLGMSGLSVTAILLSRILSGMFKHSQTLMSSHLGEQVNQQQFSSVQSYFNAFGSIGFIIGPTVAGYILEHKGQFSYIALLAAACILLNAGLVWLLFPNERLRKRSASTSGLSSFRQSIQHIREVGFSTCWDVYLVRFLLTFSVLVFRSHLALSLAEAYALGPKDIGYVISFQSTCNAAVGFLGSYYFMLYAEDEGKVTPHGSLMLCVALVGFFFQPPIYAICLILGLLCFSNTVLKVGLTRILHFRSEPGKRGAVFGVSQSITSFARMLAPMVAGFAMEYSYVGPTLIALGTASIATLISFFVLTDLGTDKVHKS